MRTIKAEPITMEGFAPFGEFYSIDKPEGYPLCGELHKFYPDRISVDSEHRIGYSPMTVKKPERMIVTQQEYHTTTWELILPVDDDMIIHCAPASGGTPVPDEVKAFIVPKNTLVKLKSAIWHLAPLPVNKDLLTVLIILPECTYANDCIVVDLKDDEQFEIVK